MAGAGAAEAGGVRVKSGLPGDVCAAACILAHKERVPSPLVSLGKDCHRLGGYSKRNLFFHSLVKK